VREGRLHSRADHVTILTIRRHGEKVFEGRHGMSRIRKKGESADMAGEKIERA